MLHGRRFLDIVTQTTPVPDRFYTNGEPNAAYGWLSILIEALARSLWCESFLNPTERMYYVSGKQYLVTPTVELIGKLMTGIEQLAKAQAPLLRSRQTPKKKAALSFAYGLAVGLKTALLDRREQIMRDTPEAMHLYAAQSFRTRQRTDQDFKVRTRQLRVHIDPMIYKLALKKGWALSWHPNPVTLTMKHEADL